jgi:hypothetical protein
VLLLLSMQLQPVRVSDYYREFDAFTLMPATATELDGACLRLPPLGLVLVGGEVRVVLPCP